MKVFRAIKNFEIIPTILILLMYNALILILMTTTTSYIILNLLRVLLISCNIFYLYHIFLWFTVKYVCTEYEIKILAVGNLKRVAIPLSSIKGYTILSGKISGIRLSGVSSNKFALGRNVIKTLGTTRMFATNNSSVIYLRTDDISYAISPVDVKEFEKFLNDNNIYKTQWEVKFNKPNKIYKDKKFKTPLFLTSIIIVIITVTPLILYFTHSLPNIMPLTFDASFNPVTMGTDRQFAFTQMIYGALNMALLFCMYYAAYFCAKYDRKTAYRYLYITLLIAVIFLFLQIRIIVSAM